MSYICAKRVETQYIKSKQLTLESPLSITNGGTGCNSLSDIKKALGVVAGTDIQPYSKKLYDIDGLSLSKDDMISFDGTNIVSKSITNNISSYYELKTVNTKTSSPSVLCSVEIPTNTSMVFDVLISFCSDTMTYSGGFQIYTCYKNIAGTVSQFDITQTVIYKPSGDFTATMDFSGTNARVLVNAKVVTKVMWTCKLISLISPKYISDP